MADRQATLKQRLYERLRLKLWQVSPRAFDRLVAPFDGQVFSIAVYEGESPLALADPARRHNPVLTHRQVTDAPAAFVADPFVLRDREQHFLFMEVFSRITRRGQIAVACSDDGLAWRYQRTVLKEPFHLAYPNVFRSGEDIYMVPDAPGMGARLYRAFDFPGDWRFQCTLIDDPGLVDSTVFRFEDRWWLMAAWAETPGGPKSLRLYHADTLAGPWTEHPQSPLIRADDRTARPCGRVLMMDGRPVRLTQDCSAVYGASVRAFVVDILTPDSYRESPAAPEPILGAGSEAWNRGGMHHLDAHPLPGVGWVAYVDGWYDTRRAAGHAE